MKLEIYPQDEIRYLENILVYANSFSETREFIMRRIKLLRASVDAEKHRGSNIK